MSDDTNPKDLVGDKKPQVWLVPPSAILSMAKVFELGAKKYGAYNWRTKKVRSTVYLAAAMRHIMSTLDGEDADSESGYAHVAHAAACMAIILDAMSTDTLIDDRPPKGKASEIIAQMTTREQV